MLSLLCQLKNDDDDDDVLLGVVCLLVSSQCRLVDIDGRPERQCTRYKSDTSCTTGQKHETLAAIYITSSLLHTMAQ